MKWLLWIGFYWNVCLQLAHLFFILGDEVSSLSESADINPSLLFSAPLGRLEQSVSEPLGVLLDLIVL